MLNVVRRSGITREKNISDNLINIDTKSEKYYNFSGGSMTIKTLGLGDPCFAQFRLSRPKMTNIKPMSQNRETTHITKQPPYNPNNIYWHQNLIL